MIIEISESIGSLLIVEDEGLVSMMLEDIVRQMGATNVHVCGDLDSAHQTAGSADIDCAVLDVRMRGGTTEAIADLLASRGVPFMYSTGGTPDSIPVQHRHRPMITKPFAEDDFRMMLLDTYMAGVNPCAPQRVATPGLTN